jgi:predicted enzyme related to lactoylglutathione lyase
MEAVEVRGQFVWHELMTRDVPGARKFYTKLVGWDAQPWSTDPNYTICSAKSGPTAGMLAIPGDFPAEMPAHWVNYIGTRDVDGTIAAAVRAGGSIVKEAEDIKGAGRFAVLKDPQGAFFAILDPENSKPDEAVAPVGTFSWHELATSDNEAAFAFYSGLFGWDAIRRMDMGPMGTYLIFGQNGVQRGGIYNKPADMPAPPNWLPYVRVPSADGGFKTAIGGGARQIVAPMDVPDGGRIASFFDPTGAAFAIHSVGTAAESVPKVAKPKPKAKAKAKAKPKAKAAAPKKKKAAKKPAPKKKVMKKAAPKKKAAAKKSVKKSVKKKPARRKK